MIPPYKDMSCIHSPRVSWTYLGSESFFSLGCPSWLVVMTSVTTQSPVGPVDSVGEENGHQHTQCYVHVLWTQSVVTSHVTYCIRLPHVLLYFSSSRKDKFPWWTNWLVVCITNRLISMPVKTYTFSFSFTHFVHYPIYCLRTGNKSRATLVYM